MKLAEQTEIAIDVLPYMAKKGELVTVEDVDRALGQNWNNVASVANAVAVRHSELKGWSQWWIFSGPARGECDIAGRGDGRRGTAVSYGR